MTALTGLPLYDRAAERAASTVIAAYSTSFALACRLLGPRVRTAVRSIYALVRVADEIVDGSAGAAGLGRDEVRRTLTALEADTLRAVEEGFSADLVVHAFARTARACGIGPDLVRPFFAAMRTDVDVRTHDDASRTAYVHGSAGVVGLMCLQAFLNAGRLLPAVPDDVLREGAHRLGTAFQEINFLRDADDDRDRLGRDYLGLAASPTARADALDRIRADLDAGARCIPLLPRDCRRAVRLAHALFAALTRRLAAADPGGRRVRLGAAHKAWIAARVLAGRT